MTIRHVVAFRLATEDPVLRAEQAAHIARSLLELQGVVPELLSISAGAEALFEQNWDVALVADFADRAGLDAYQVHPAHVAVSSYVRSVLAERAAVDFEV